MAYGIEVFKEHFSDYKLCLMFMSKFTYGISKHAK